MITKLILFGFFLSSSFFFVTKVLANEVLVYKFHNERLGDNFIKIQPKTPTTAATGFSICLNAMFSTLNDRYLFESDTMILNIDDYKYKYGYYYDFKVWYTFLLDKMSISPTSWNSFCVLYNQSDLALNVTINGKVARSLKNHTFNIENLSSPITIGGITPNNRFAGQVTNLNFWNRPLSLSEMEEYYSSVNNSSFAEKLIPELVMWSEVNIIEIGNGTSNYSIENEFLQKCQDLPVLFVEQLPYDKSFKTCESFNGALLEEGNANECFLKKEKTNLKDGCSNKFWIFSNKSIIISNETGKDEKNKLLCLLFDANKRKEANCNEKNCFVCKIPQSKMKFEMKSLSTEKSRIENSYFLVNKDGKNLFSGIYGKTIIKSTIPSKTFWTVFDSKPGNITEVGKLNGSTTYPIGLQTLVLSQESNESLPIQIKLSNVSMELKWVQE